MRLIRILALCSVPAVAAAQPASVQLLHRFEPSPANPIGNLVQVPDGSFYGVTTTGIIRVSSGGDVTQVARITDGVPSGSLIRASDGALYGMTVDGGPKDWGTIFRFDPSTEILRRVHAFVSPTEGAKPAGGLVQVGGSLHGVTRYGGSSGSGTVFQVVVATGAVITDASFPDPFGVELQNRIETPSGSLTLGPDGRLYGVSDGGGGTLALYAFDPASRAITPAHVVSSFDGSGALPAQPLTLTLGPGGSLYGSAPGGGIDRAGTIFRYTPATDRFDRLYNLVAANGLDGRSPGPLLAASDGHFYGVTSRRSNETPGGTLFRFRAGAGGTFTYEPLTQLDPLVAGAPANTTLTQGADGLIYGYATGGGPNGTGTLFRFDPAGAGPPSNPVAFTVRQTFPFVSAWGPSAPVLGPDGLLYGMTSFGGATNRGAAYRVTPATGAVTMLGSLPGTGIATASVNSTLVAGPDGRLYGVSKEVTSSGAATRILRVDRGSGLVTIAVDGVGPPDPLVQSVWITIRDGLVRSASGQLFGMRLDRQAGLDRIYRFDPSTDTFTDVAALTANGAKSNLVALANGDVVLLATLPGESGSTTSWRSVLIRLNPAMANGYDERLLSPQAFTGGRVILGADGYLYVRSDEVPNYTLRRVNPTTGATTALCGDAFSPPPDPLSVGADGALYGFAGSEVQRRLYRCDPTSGAIAVGATLPSTIDFLAGPMARVGNLLYGAALEQPYYLPEERPAGVLFQLATPGTALPSMDTDGDALPNGWETAFGLDPFDAGRGNGAADDPDGDGRTNAQELADGTHPRGFVTRLFAEGASNGFFRTRFDIANPYDGPGAIVRARFQTDTGSTVAADLVVAPWGHLGIDPSTLSGMPQGSFSAVFESDTPIAVDRTMSWDATGYGSHLETGIAAPSTQWYFAEGSTSGDFSLFYLLQNPRTITVTATVRFLRPFGQPPIDRTYTLPPTSRTTIVVDTAAPELASSDVSAVITATGPIVAERAMYVNRPGQAFAAGHESAGVTAPALDWFLAEGATGAFFDLFVLIANPSTTASTVSVEYLRASGPPLIKTYVVPAQSRITIWVDDEQLPAGSGQRPLAEGSISTAVHVTNGVPVIVERAMWWPGPQMTSNFWYEAHNSPGATGVATRWVIGGAEIGGVDAADTYVLIANTADRAGMARLWRLYDGPFTSSVFATDIPLPAKSRTTVNLGPGGALSSWSGVLVESSGLNPVPIVVERATYASPGGVFWSRGGNALAMPLP